MHFLIWETLSFNLMYVTACYPVGTTISKTSSHFTALLQHYKGGNYNLLSLLPVLLHLLSGVACDSHFCEKYLYVLSHGDTTFK